MEARTAQEVLAHDARQHDLIADVLGDGDDGHRHQKRQHGPGDRPRRFGELSEEDREVRHPEDLSGGDRREVDHAEDRRRDIATDDPEQHRNDGEEPLQCDGEDQNAGQREEGDQKVRQTIIADGLVGRHAHGDRGEAQADHHDHRADHDRWQEAHQPADAE